MIKDKDIVEVGHFNKPHGINGEISATLDVADDLADFKCIICEIDGIYVPFFINNVRPKSKETVLLHIDGVDTELVAKGFINKSIFVLKAETSEIDEQDDGNFANFFIGFKVVDNEIGDVGEIMEIDDSTDNPLFILSNGERDIYIPITTDFILNIDYDNKVLLMELPVGITEM
ncbi:MAG: ribosome maturation factor RimM [Bacteroidales bacterium]